MLVIDDDLIERALAQSWRPRAACAVTDEKADWFPRQHHAHDAAVTAAYRICAGCPVRPECLVLALVVDEHRDKGIFGGLGPRARFELRRQLAETGSLKPLRQCANPGCRRWFAAKVNTPRRGVCCSNECRLARRRRLRRQGGSRAAQKAGMVD